jgi:hypothetical protein
MWLDYETLVLTITYMFETGQHLKLDANITDNLATYTPFKIVEIFCAKCTVETSIDNKITNLL